MMSALIFVQHLNQLAGLVRGNVAVTILEVQNHRFSHSRANGTVRVLRTFLTMPVARDLARIRPVPKNASWWIALRSIHPRCRAWFVATVHDADDEESSHGREGLASFVIRAVWGRGLTHGVSFAFRCYGLPGTRGGKLARPHAQMFDVEIALDRFAEFTPAESQIVIVPQAAFPASPRLKLPLP